MKKGYLVCIAKLLNKRPKAERISSASCSRISTAVAPLKKRDQ